MSATFSLVVNHTPWREERCRAKTEMLVELLPLSRGVPFLLHDTDYRGLDWQQEGKVRWALRQWEWALSTRATHHVFLTDDLRLASRWWACLEAMVEACPDRPIGLLSNHPEAMGLYMRGFSWYATNSWLVGPAYVMPHELLERFVGWFLSLPDGDWRTPGTRAYRNDDSSINEWVTHHGGGRTLHPLPTIIEHRADLESTVGHGDRYSRERLSWRAHRGVRDVDEGRFEWIEQPFTVNEMNNSDERDPLWSVDTWKRNGGPEAAPLLNVGG